jgi:hypothetical protein
MQQTPRGHVKPIGHSGELEGFGQHLDLTVRLHRIGVPGRGSVKGATSRLGP